VAINAPNTLEYRILDESASDTQIQQYTIGTGTAANSTTDVANLDIIEVTYVSNLDGAAGARAAINANLVLKIVITTANIGTE
jgi:hypothetical protein